MNYLAVLIPVALSMGAVGLLAFLWSLRAGQYDDLEGAAERVLLDDEDDGPLADPVRDGTASGRQSSRPKEDNEPKLYSGVSNAKHG